MIAILIRFFQVDDVECEWRAHGTQICQIKVDAKKNSQEVFVRVLGLYRIDPGRLSSQCRTGADRCTPTLPR